MDETGTYVPESDGTRRYAVMTGLRVDKKPIYEFNKGVLRISASPETLEVLAKQIGELPKEGRDLALPAPFDVEGGVARFKGVREIELIPDTSVRICIVQPAA